MRSGAASEMTQGVWTRFGGFWVSGLGSGRLAGLSL